MNVALSRESNLTTNQDAFRDLKMFLKDLENAFKVLKELFLKASIFEKE